MIFTTRPAGFWTLARLLLTFSTFSLVVSILVAGCTGQVGNNNNSNTSATTNPGQPPNKTVAANNPNNPPTGGPLPAEIMNTELKSLDGKTFKLSDYKGKVVLVNLWATWCGPCRVETPDLVKVSQDFQARGVEVIGLTSEDPMEDETLVKEFVKKYNVPYLIGWSNQSVVMGLMQGNVRNSIPQSFIITRDGRVHKRFVGFNQTETPPKLRQALEEALSQG